MNFEFLIVFYLTAGKCGFDFVTKLFEKYLKRFATVNMKLRLNGKIAIDRLDKWERFYVC